MSVKRSYKIPAGLNASYGDMELAVQSKDGLGVKPLPIKVIVTYIGSILLCFYVCTKTVVSHGSFVQIGAFVILWIAMTLTLAKFDGTKRMQVQFLPTLINYLPKASRNIITRTSAKANGFYKIAGIESINKKTGLIEYADGTYAYMYLVVGSASILLFDADKEAIISRVDSFYRKIGFDVELIFTTTKESQKVYNQVASLKKRYNKLTVRDPDLELIANEQLDVLNNYVGGSFRSIHQYLTIKADNKEALVTNKNVLQSEVENSSRMIKRCVALYYDDINEVCKTIYQSD